MEISRNGGLRRCGAEMSLMLQKYKCKECGKPATHKFTRIREGQIIDIYLCAEHAAESSPYQKPKSLSNILESLLKQNLGPEGAAPAIVPGAAGQRCGRCGLTFENYRRNLMLGCSDCYAAFREFLIPELRKFHGDTRHTGRRPGGGLAHPAPPAFTPGELADESAMPVEKPSPSMGGQALLKNPQQALAELTRALKKAISDEEYARAAILRDQIRELRQNLNLPPETV